MPPVAIPSQISQSVPQLTIPRGDKKKKKKESELTSINLHTALATRFANFSTVIVL